VIRGHLPPDKRGQSDVKHRIRREFHPQLKTFWQVRHARAFQPERDGRIPVERLADKYARCGFRFVPLVHTKAWSACWLDILLLRRDEPFRVFSATGDIDGRVKTLLDGLRMPQQCSEVSGQSPAPDEDPFYVLLEDDALVHGFTVTTDRLLVPPEPQEPERDVVAVVTVDVRNLDGSEMAVVTGDLY
jgi:hypothetical protein